MRSTLPTAQRACRPAQAKYAAGLEPEQRSILLALCNEDAAGFYGLASEMVYS